MKSLYINIQKHKEQEGLSGNFKYKEKVYIKISKNSVTVVECSITGKVKNANAYIVFALDYRFTRELRNKYGYPIRHIALEWGNFTGKSNEFIIKATDIQRHEWFNKNSLSI